MKSTLFKVSSLLLLCLPVFAATVHINYTDSSMYTKMSSELSSMGYTVTGTNSGSVTLNDFTNKDLHIMLQEIITVVVLVRQHTKVI